MQNFWENRNWQNEDRHLLSVAKAPFQRQLPEVKITNGLFVIRGPRQVGKSFWLKKLLATLPPDKCYYQSCENLRDHLDLAELFKSQKSRQFVLLDEISFVSQWWRAVKNEIDSQSKKTIILTGSHSADLKQGADTMPGRFAPNGDIELLPMTFEEFLQCRKKAGWKISKNHEENILGYLKVGGFPTAVIEGGQNFKHPQQAIEIYKRWLLGDLVKLGKQEIYLAEMMSQLALTQTSTLSLQTLAQKTQMGSHMTAQSYVELLEACFAVKTLYSLDPEKNRFHFKKEKKFYFRDPLIYYVALDWAGLEIPKNHFEVLAELVAHEQLHRKTKRMGYFSNKSGEVDFISAKKWAIEVKWSSENPNLSKAYKNLHIPEKIVWSKNNLLQEWPQELMD